MSQVLRMNQVFNMSQVLNMSLKESEDAMITRLNNRMFFQKRMVEAFIHGI